MAEEGYTIGERYRLLTQIGEGGMSRVYLALDTVLNKQWAAKEIKHVEDPAQRELIVKSLVTEANMIKRFDHPAIPRIVDIIDEEGTLYVIMDYVEGRTLAEILELEGPQSEEKVVDWALQLLDALEYLHQRKPPVIYRDMKPANVMLKPNGLVELIDFGIAREYREDGSSTTAAIGDTVQLGTRGFAPPEQYGGSGQTDARTDVYALGATMYNLVTGKNPSDPPYTMAPIRQVRPELSAGLERIIAKATQANPDDRYQGCAEMAYDLAHYREEDDQHKATLRRTWHGFVGLVAAACVSLAVGIGGTVGYNVTLNSNYDYWMNIAEQSSDKEEASEAYVRAAAIKPGEVDPYLGLCQIYRADLDFSAEEERQIREALLPHISELEQSPQWGEMAFSIGKLYWYNYGVNDAAENADELDAGRASRIRAASQWMHNAADAPGFENAELAQVYADIADFNTDIVPLINEGSDAGMYGPYYERLSALVDVMSNEDNEVMRLEVANLTLDACRTYSRKFRADGVSDLELLNLCDRTQALAEDTQPTTELLDDERTQALASVNPARQAVNDAYVDVEA